MGEASGDTRPSRTVILDPQSLDLETMHSAGEAPHLWHPIVLVGGA